MASTAPVSALNMAPVLASATNANAESTSRSASASITQQSSQPSPLSKSNASTVQRTLGKPSITGQSRLSSFMTRRSAVPVQQSTIPQADSSIPDHATTTTLKPSTTSIATSTPPIRLTQHINLPQATSTTTTENIPQTTTSSPSPLTKPPIPRISLDNLRGDKDKLNRNRPTNNHKDETGSTTTTTTLMAAVDRAFEIERNRPGATGGPGSRPSTVTRKTSQSAMTMGVPNSSGRMGAASNSNSARINTTSGSNINNNRLNIISGSGSGKPNVNPSGSIAFGGRVPLSLNSMSTLTTTTNIPKKSIHASRMVPESESDKAIPTVTVKVARVGGTGTSTSTGNVNGSGKVGGGGSNGNGRNMGTSVNGSVVGSGGIAKVKRKPAGTTAGKAIKSDVKTGKDGSTAAMQSSDVTVNQQTQTQQPYQQQQDQPTATSPDRERDRISLKPAKISIEYAELVRDANVSELYQRTLEDQKINQEAWGLGDGAFGGNVGAGGGIGGAESKDRLGGIGNNNVKRLPDMDYVPVGGTSGNPDWKVAPVMVSGSTGLHADPVMIPILTQTEPSSQNGSSVTKSPFDVAMKPEPKLKGWMGRVGSGAGKAVGTNGGNVVAGSNVGSTIAASNSVKKSLISGPVKTATRKKSVSSIAGNVNGGKTNGGVTSAKSTIDSAVPITTSTATAATTTTPPGTKGKETTIMPGTGTGRGSEIPPAPPKLSTSKSKQTLTQVRAKVSVAVNNAVDKTASFMAAWWGRSGGGAGHHRQRSITAFSETSSMAGGSATVMSANNQRAGGGGGDSAMLQAGIGSDVVGNGVGNGGVGVGAGVGTAAGMGRRSVSRDPRISASSGANLKSFAGIGTGIDEKKLGKAAKVGPGATGAGVSPATTSMAKTGSKTGGMNRTFSSRASSQGTGGVNSAGRSKSVGREIKNTLNVLSQARKSMTVNGKNSSPLAAGLNVVAKSLIPRAASPSGNASANPSMPTTKTSVTVKPNAASTTTSVATPVMKVYNENTSTHREGSTVTDPHTHPARPSSRNSAASQSKRGSALPIPIQGLFGKRTTPSPTPVAPPATVNEDHDPGDPPSQPPSSPAPPSTVAPNPPTEVSEGNLESSLVKLELPAAIIPETDIVQVPIASAAENNNGVSKGKGKVSLITPGSSPVLVSVQTGRDRRPDRREENSKDNENSVKAAATSLATGPATLPASPVSKDHDGLFEAVVYDSRMVNGEVGDGGQKNVENNRELTNGKNVEGEVLLEGLNESEVMPPWVVQAGVVGVDLMGGSAGMNGYTLDQDFDAGSDSDDELMRRVGMWVVSSASVATKVDLDAHGKPVSVSFIGDDGDAVKTVDFVEQQVHGSMSLKEETVLAEKGAGTIFMGPLTAEPGSFAGGDKSPVIRNGASELLANGHGGVSAHSYESLFDPKRTEIEERRAEKWKEMVVEEMIAPANVMNAVNTARARRDGPAMLKRGSRQTIHMMEGWGVDLDDRSRSKAVTVGMASRTESAGPGALVKHVGGGGGIASVAAAALPGFSFGSLGRKKPGVGATSGNKVEKSEDVADRVEVEKVYMFKNSDKFSRRLFKGIPHLWRGHVWYYLLTNYSGIYHRQSRSQINEIEAEWIEELDQFQAYKSYFQEEVYGDAAAASANTLLFGDQKEASYQSLKRMLLAFSQRDLDLGYVPQMAQIGAMLLSVMEEERAYIAMIHLYHIAFHPSYQALYGLKALHCPGLPALAEMLFIHEQLSKLWMPRLCDRFAALGIKPIHYGTDWYLSLFIACTKRESQFQHTSSEDELLPFRILLRVWDVVLFLGLDCVCVLGLALLRKHEARLMKLKTKEEVLRFLLPNSENHAYTTPVGPISATFPRSRPKTPPNATNATRRHSEAGVVNGSTVPVPPKEGNAESAQSAGGGHATPAQPIWDLEGEEQFIKTIHALWFGPGPGTTMSMAISSLLSGSASGSGSGSGHGGTGKDVTSLSSRTRSSSWDERRGGRYLVPLMRDAYLRHGKGWLGQVDVK
ncbi:USP6 N-terminal-like protein [Blyttiomyces sp. JEL0837]|nr:USP6 N-terminal-like protein [Blyttiomyces sp. JEL0837]